MALMLFDPGRPQRLQNRFELASIAYLEFLAFLRLVLSGKMQPEGSKIVIGENDAARIARHRERQSRGFAANFDDIAERHDAETRNLDWNVIESDRSEERRVGKECR